jgi:hypothetical protein
MLHEHASRILTLNISPCRSFPTQSLYAELEHIDAYSYSASVDVPAVEDAFAQSPISSKSQNLPVTQFSVVRYPVAEASVPYDGEQLDDVLHPFRRYDLCQ